VRLYVPVDHTALVGESQSVGYLQDHPGGGVRAEGLALAHPVLEVPSGDVLHGHVVRPVLRASPVVDRDHVGVVQSGGVPRLAPEKPDELLVVDVLAAQDLERHVPVQNLVVG
jgi:hypothetical protein